MIAGQTLSTLVETSDRLKQIGKENIQRGDCLFIQTGNSLYCLRALGEGWYETSGGWFDKQGKSPMRVRINGCTWGGKMIKVNIVAACGLCLEFSNRVVTSPIKRIIIFRNASLN